MKKLIVICFSSVFLLFIGLVGSILFLVNGDDEGSDKGGVLIDGRADVNEAIERYRDSFEKYAKMFGIEEHVEVIMAIAMQESGGRHLDIMQASESLGLPPNTIIDPVYSIEVGVKYFSEVLKKADGKVKLALQSYNFGTGFINYAFENGGEYSRELATAFSKMKQAELGWDGYGDVLYVPHVMRYVGVVNSEPIFNDGADWAFPLKKIIITSEMGWRTHPISGIQKFHGGIDFDCTNTDPVYSVKDGVVIKSVISPILLGNHVLIKHDENEYSVYGHLSSLNVEKGDEVIAGDRVGVCGTTGSSTGTHLHLEWRTENVYAPKRINKDPRIKLGIEK